jgi:predicted alpha/beta superfamily hydrolase
VIVHLPPGYELLPDRRFPVLYLQDGQNLFDAHTAFGGVPWGIDEVAERLARAGVCWPVILVGVGNTPDRHREYGPKENGAAKGTNSDLSRRFGRCLVQEIKPFVDATYRTLSEPENTGVGGSSLGGLISLHLAQWYPDVFGLCCAMSPSLWWDHEYFLRSLNASPDWIDRVRLWLDVGGREGMTRKTQLGTARRVRRLAKMLDLRGRREGLNYKFLEVPDAGHNEAAWGARFDRVLRFLFGPDVG